MARSFVALQQLITEVSLKQGRAAGIDAGLKYCEEWKKEYAVITSKIDGYKREIDAKKGKIPVPEYNKLVSDQNKRTVEAAKMKTDLENSIGAMNKLVAQKK